MTELDDDWRCPGCGKPWEELPVGHVIPVGVIGHPEVDLTGRCSDVKPMLVTEFMAMPAQTGNRWSPNPDEWPAQMRRDWARWQPDAARWRQ